LKKVNGWSSKLDTPFEITANEFMTWAVEDSKLDLIHNWVNALGNVKRAIECRTDELLYAMCLHVKSETEKWSFPKKVESLQHLGIIAPKILNKINKKRNQLEHQYIKPTKDDVEDALDVANLFIGYTEKYSMKGYRIAELRFGERAREERDLILIDRKNNTILIREKDNEHKLTIGSEDVWLKIAKEIVARII
jgi:hypothetical protein